MRKDRISKLAADLIKALREVHNDVTGKRRLRRHVRGLMVAAETAEHPYAAAIAAAKQTHPMIFINCSSRGSAFAGRPIPDGELGPQCDALRENGAGVLAMDDRYVYCDDGERYEWRRPAREARRAG